MMRVGQSTGLWSDAGEENQMGIQHPNYLPTRSLAAFDSLPNPSDRKLRLFMIECHRRVADLTGQPRLATAMEVCGDYVDGRSTSSEYFAAFEAEEHARYRETLLHIARPTVRSAAREVLVNTVRHIADEVTAREHPDLRYANEGAEWEAFWEVKCKPIPAEDEVRVAWLEDLFGDQPAAVSFSDSWRSEAATGLAHAAYDARNFSLLPVLADALEEAGCDNLDLLHHCRGEGPHVRGCWVVDLVLGKQ
jgi:hypothetical protein